jgi:hypothetical protein
MRPEKKQQIELEADEKLLLLFEANENQNGILTSKIRFKW